MVIADRTYMRYLNDDGSVHKVVVCDEMDALVFTLYVRGGKIYDGSSPEEIPRNQTGGDPVFNRLLEGEEINSIVDDFHPRLENTLREIPLCYFVSRGNPLNFDLGLSKIFRIIPDKYESEVKAS